MKKIIIIVIVVAIAGFLFFIGKKDSDKPKIKRTPVKRNEVIEKAIAIGQIVPDPTPIEFAQAKRQMEIARVSMSNAKTECERMTQLHDQKWVSRQEFDDCKQLFDESKLRFEMAKENFDLISKGKIELAGKKVDNIIRSPIDGMVLNFTVDEGDPVVPLTSYQEGTPLMTVADMTTLIFKGTVDEIDVGKIREGISARIIAGALPDNEIKGVVDKISPQAKRENNSTLFDIEIKLCSTNITELRAGYSATARIIIAKTNNVLTIPERLIFYSNDVSYVEISKSEESNETEIIPVTTGLSDGMITEIKNGLKENDFVVERLKEKK